MVAFPFFYAGKDDERGTEAFVCRREKWWKDESSKFFLQTFVFSRLVGIYIPLSHLLIHPQSVDFQEEWKGMAPQFNQCSHYFQLSLL